MTERENASDATGRPVAAPVAGTFAAAWTEASAAYGASEASGRALWRAVAHVAADRRPGALVEVGAAPGGAELLIAAAGAAGLDDRKIFEFSRGTTAPAMDEAPTKGRPVVVADVRRYDIVRARTGVIAVLRLVGLNAEETQAALAILYPRLAPGGVLIADRTPEGAVTAYFETLEADWRRPFFSEIDAESHLGLKPPTAPASPDKRYDYAPPGLRDPDLLPAFPSLLATDPGAVSWPWLRRSTPHVWRTDGRSAKALIGVLSYEEALLLHNLALPFTGLPALEIGCHLAWSTAHLLAAGLSLDVIDPALGGSEHLETVEHSLAAAAMRAPGSGEARLYGGFSPSITGAVAAARGAPWSFAFIDGWHDGDGPTRDGEAVLPHMAENAMVVFHDILCPAVAAGAQLFAARGWNMRVFNTTQMMACCWRGAVEPPAYEPDPNMPASTIGHVSGLATVPSR